MDEYLRSTDMDAGDKRNIKFYLATYLVSKLTGKAAPGIQIIEKIDLAAASDVVMAECLKPILTKYQSLGGDDASAKGSALLKWLKNHLARRFAKNLKLKLSKAKS